MTTYMIDIAIILALAFFAWRGAKKGLILTLFGLLAIFVAFFGARAVAANFSQPVSNIIRPSIQLAIDDVLSGETPAPLPSADPSADPAETDSAAPTQSPAVTPDVSEIGDGDFTLQEILDLMGESELFAGLRGFLEEAVEEQRLAVTTTASAAVAAYLAQLAGTAITFGVSFLVILLAWFLVSRALDLAFKLPILSAVNTLGGLLIGLVKGVLILLVLVWLARLAGLLTDGNAGPLARLMTVQGLSDLLRSLMAG